VNRRILISRPFSWDKYDLPYCLQPAQARNISDIYDKQVPSFTVSQQQLKLPQGAVQYWARRVVASVKVGPLGSYSLLQDLCGLMNTSENYVSVHRDKIMEKLELFIGDFNEV
jgi:hypothetical protein